MKQKIVQDCTNLTKITENLLPKTHFNYLSIPGASIFGLFVIMVFDSQQPQVESSKQHIS